jgi:gluconate 2-dehydrogenase subunit 3-like protein
MTVPTGALDAARTGALGAVVERILPADGRGPGALELGALDYLTAALVGELAHLRSLYADLLDELDRRAVAAYGGPLASLDDDALDVILRAAEAGEAGVEAQEGFGLLRGHVLEGAFGDPRHGGNRNRAGWRLIGYPGPALRLSEAEQALDGSAPAGPSSADEIRDALASGSIHDR